MSKQKRDGVSDARLKLEYRSVEDLVPYARNARLHSDDQIAQLARPLWRLRLDHDRGGADRTSLIPDGTVSPLCRHDRASV